MKNTKKISNKPVTEIEEILRRQQKILNNTELISRLSDRGEKVSENIRKLKEELEHHREIDELTFAFSNLKINAQDDVGMPIRTTKDEKVDDHTLLQDSFSKQRSEKLQDGTAVESNPFRLNMTKKRRLIATKSGWTKPLSDLDLELSALSPMFSEKPTQLSPLPESTTIQKIQQKKLEDTNITIASWNVAGVKNKGKDFWNIVTQYDVIGLLETWTTSFVEVNKMLPFGYKWVHNKATKVNKKGRAKGGMLIGIRDTIEHKETIHDDKLITVKMSLNKYTINVTWGYNIKKTFWDSLQKIGKTLDSKYWIVLGDMNARIGTEETDYRDRKMEQAKPRQSKDKKRNENGKLLLKWSKEYRMSILNGNCKGDEIGEWTFIAERGRSVIDYGIVREGGENIVEDFRVDLYNCSDHLPIVVVTTAEREIKKKKQKKLPVQSRYKWSDEGIKNYQENLKGFKSAINQDINQKWNNLCTRICEAVKLQPKKRRNKPTWWTEKNEALKKEKEIAWVDYKDAVKDTEEERREKYILVKKLFKYEIEISKKKWAEKERQEMNNIKTEDDLVKRMAQKRKPVRYSQLPRDITGWEGYFKSLLNGPEEGTVAKSGDITPAKDTESEQNISEEEFNQVIRKLKKNEAAGEDGIENEAWINMTKDIESDFFNLIREIWITKQIPERWRLAVIKPITILDEDRIMFESYKGIALLNTGYNVLAKIMNKRLKNELEKKCGFRHGQYPLDNIHVLSKSIEVENKKGKIYMFFADFSSALDVVNRQKLWRIMKKFKIDKELIQMIENIYEMTRNVVDIKGHRTGVFLSNRGLRQGCPLSDTLINLYVKYLEEKLRRNQKGGIYIDGIKTWILTYADNIVLVANRPDELHSMIGIFEKYGKSKGFKINLNESKIQVFKKGEKAVYI